MDGFLFFIHNKTRKNVSQLSKANKRVDVHKSRQNEICTYSVDFSTITVKIMHRFREPIFHI